VTNPKPMLDGVRVLECSLLGPAAITSHLVDLGAEVIKVESPFLGDYLRIEDTWLGRDGAQGAVERIAWDVKWHSGRPMPAELPTWLPAPTHASMITYDAEATGKVVVDGRSVELAGRASAMHLWGKKHVPTLQWIWAPWMGGASLEIEGLVSLPLGEIKAAHEDWLPSYMNAAE